MITIRDFQIETLADAPAMIDRILKSEYRVNDLGVLPLEEKLEILSKMENIGLFAMRGSVRFAATLLDLSRTTIYKHLKES